MENKGNYFSRASKVFWGIILLILFAIILKFSNVIFKGQNIAENIIRNDSLSKIDWEETLLELDTAKIKEDTTANNIAYINKTWKWKDFKDRAYVLNFKISQKEYLFSRQQRVASSKYGGNLYDEMYTNDNHALTNMIDSYKRIIQSKKLNYMESMEMIVTSIQNIPYVLVSMEDCPKSEFGLKFSKDCKPHVNPNGCCAYVMPFAVYSPVEFAVQGTADCDTRSLFAYTILKRLGFEVAVMTSEKESHSVLGVALPNRPSDGRRGNIGQAKQYYLWELTVYGPVLGQYIEGNDWEIALN